MASTSEQAQAQLLGLCSTFVSELPLRDILPFAPGKGNFASQSAPKSVICIQKQDGLSTTSSPALINASKLMGNVLILFNGGSIGTKRHN